MDRPKPVVYIVIDGMSTTAFERVTSSGQAPALEFLRNRGRYARDSVAIFPTITPAASASLVTGAIPADHGVPGMCWYDRAAQRYVNYGQSPRAALQEGVTQIVRDVLTNLNENHLSRNVKTIHESLGERGLTSASINFMIFRGPHIHEVKPNLLGRLFFKRHLPKTLSGPKEHYFADVISGPANACTPLLSAKGIQRMKASDEWAACVTRELLDRKAADMILFYLHENDHHSHDHGPEGQIDSLAETDKHVAHVLDLYGDWERATDSVGFVVTADHSQSPIGNDKEYLLDLDDVLADFTHIERGRGKEPFRDADVAAAGNGRAGFVYLNEERRERLRDPVVETLARVRGVDQIMWRREDRYYVRSDKGEFSFWSSGDGVSDERGNKWSFEGELNTVGGTIEGDELVTPEYPLALWRIKAALDLDRIGDIVITMKLTYECSDLGGGHHLGGGDHASLHAQDSLVPFLSTLDDPPLHPSTIDVVPHILRHFGAA